VVADDPRSMIEALSGLLDDPDRASARARGHDAVAGAPHLGRRLGPLLQSVAP